MKPVEFFLTPGVPENMVLYGTGEKGKECALAMIVRRLGGLLFLHLHLFHLFPLGTRHLNGNVYIIIGLGTWP